MHRLLEVSIRVRERYILDRHFLTVHQVSFNNVNYRSGQMFACIIQIAAKRNRSRKVENLHKQTGW